MVVPSLLLLCLTSVVRPLQYSCSIEVCLAHYEKFRIIERLGLEVSSDETIKSCFLEYKEKILNSVAAKFPTILERYGYESLSNFFDPAMLQQLERQLGASETTRKHFAHLRTGIVLEKSIASVDLYQPDMDGFYSPTVLYSGVQWPEGIDIKKREQYLSPDDFESIFAFTKEEFNRLPSYKQLRMRKDKKLF